MTMVRLPHRLLLACCFPLGIALPVHADEADVVNFKAAASILEDDNLFRVPDSGGLKPESETITTTVFGVDFDKRVSLQRFIAHASWVDTRYLNNDYLNAGALRYDGKWLWAVGSRLTGEVSADRSAAQNSFSDPGATRQRNLRVTENQRFGLDFAINPSWHMLGGISRLTMTNDRQLTTESDFEATGTSLGIKYTPASGNWASFQTRRHEGTYTKRPFDPSAGIRFDNEFTQSGQEIAVGWQPTGHSSFNGRLEYLRREHAHLSDRDFSGWTGQLSYLYQYSAKTSFTLAYLRALNAFQQASSSYYVADDLSLASHWAATSKIGIATRLGYSHRQYQGEVVALNAPRQKDHVYRAGVDATYQFARWLELRAGLALEKRNSNNNGQDFTDRQALLSANAQF